MRSKRIRKSKKISQSLILGAQLLAIWYALIFTIGYLTSETMASFSSSSEITGKIKAGEWWDGSNLVFIGKGNQNEKVCPSTEISVEIKNTGITMIGSTTYEVYYIENGNPQNGKIIEKGDLKPLMKNEVVALSYQAEEEGVYMFKAYQREGYVGEKEVIWSEKVKVKCKEKIEKNEESTQNDNQQDLNTNEEITLEKQEENIPKEENEEKKVKKEVQEYKNIGDEAEKSISIQSIKENEMVPEASNEGTKDIVVEEKNNEAIKEAKISEQINEDKSELVKANEEPIQEGE